MPSRLAAVVGLAVASGLLVGCASKRPVLYPNPHYNRVGTEVAEIDVEECMQTAKAQVGREGAGSRAAKGTAMGGSTGAAAGAAAGAVRGTAGTSAARGAAAGATVGLMRGLFRAREPDPIYKQFVQVCLADRGYRVIGWR